MITVSARCRAILDAGGYETHVRAESWLAGEQLAESIPVQTGTEDFDLGLNVPERVTLTVPRRDQGVTWTPTQVTDPLAAQGQIIKISLGVQVGLNAIEWFQRGEFVLVATTPDQDLLRLELAGRLYLVAEAGFASPFQPSGTIAATLRALVEPAISVDLDNAPEDRAVPAGVNWDNRLGAVNELIDAWPAIARTTELGYLEVLPDVAPTVAVRAFTDRAGGTMVRAAAASTRVDGFNVVVATGQADDGGEVRGMAQVTSGPWAYGTGPANPLPVPFGYASPLIKTNPQCLAAARTVLARKQRTALARRFTVTCVPDPTIQLGDPVEITNDEVTGLLCTVQTSQLPYTPGPQVMQVVSVS